MSNVKSQIQILNLKSKLLMPNVKIQMTNQCQIPNVKCQINKLQIANSKSEILNLKSLILDP